MFQTGQYQFSALHTFYLELDRSLHFSEKKPRMFTFKHQLFEITSYVLSSKRTLPSQSVLSVFKHARHALSAKTHLFSKHTLWFSMIPVCIHAYIHFERKFVPITLRCHQTWLARKSLK